MTIMNKLESMEYGPAPESAAKANAWLDGHGRSFGHFIGGEWVAGGSEVITSTNPATGEKLADIAAANAADIDTAVAAARKAQPAWTALGGHGRARYMYALARLVQKHSRILSVLESLDNGKPIRETRDIDIPLVARHFYHHAGWAQTMESELPGMEALGVAAQVIPWNFPLLMLAWKVAPAIAAGNTVVLKPAEYTSLSALMFAELCMEAGLPAGVVNIVTGAGDSGSLLTGHADVNKVAFTGSTGVGRLIRRQIAGSGKKLTLELGGKSPYIVFEDADLDSAVEGLVDAIWFNQGQVCCAGSRLLVQEGIEERFLEKVKARMAKLRIGNPLDKCIDIGAVVDPVQRERIDSMVKAGKAEGATIWQPECDLPADGCFYPPTLITDVGADNICYREEIFGPVLTVMSFRTQKEAVQLANNTRYGLAATVWSESLGRALEVAPALKAGVVWINGTNMFDASVGFGGMRESGFGREGGIEGMMAYLKPVYEAGLRAAKPVAVPAETTLKAGSGLPQVDKTAKMYIGGKQARPDGGDSLTVLNHKGVPAGLVGDGNYKDIRNAVEAAGKATAGWAGASQHLRAQILYYIGENLSARADGFAARLVSLTGASKKDAASEVEECVKRLFTAAAMADKFEGRVHQPPIRGVALAMNEAIGILAVSCPDDSPLLAFVTLTAHAIAAGNSVVALPSERFPLLATDFYQILETSDLPGGVINIVTGKHADLIPPLAKHLSVDALWHFSDPSLEAMVEHEAAENMKRTWMAHGKAYDWAEGGTLSGRDLMARAVEVKNIWVPYGDSNLPMTGGGY